MSDRDPAYIDNLVLQEGFPPPPPPPHDAIWASLSELEDNKVNPLRKDVDRWMDDLEKRGDETSDNEAAIKALQATLAEQSALIAGQRAAIEALRGWIQERADGVSNLGMRVAKLEDAAQEWRDRQHGINSDIYRDMHRYDDKLALASINGDDAMDQRIQARAIELEHRIDEERRAWQDADVSLLRVHGPVHLRLNEDMQANLSRFDQLEAHAHRVREQFPQVATQTTEEDNRE